MKTPKPETKLEKRLTRLEKLYDSHRHESFNGLPYCKVKRETGKKNELVFKPAKS